MEYIQHINPWDVVILCIIIAGSVHFTSYLIHLWKNINTWKNKERK